MPEFAAFVLMRNDEGVATLVEYFQQYVSIARKHRIGLILETPTWRASSKWGAILGYSEDALELVNRKAIELESEMNMKMRKLNLSLVVASLLSR